MLLMPSSSVGSKASTGCGGGDLPPIRPGQLGSPHFECLVHDTNDNAHLFLLSSALEFRS